MSIKFSEIIRISNPKEYKIHLATWNGHHQPLDIFISDKERWKGWNEWRGEKDEFNRQYIFSLIDFYHEKDTWLFGGIYKVLKRSQKKYARSYKVELTNQYNEMIGRLKFHWQRFGRAKSRKMEKCKDEFLVSEILKGEFTGEVFCGYENINHDFSSIETIYKNNKQDWKAALENIKGIYLVTDKRNGKKYVGSAYGDYGIWSRWACYIKNGHGKNDELSKVINQKGIEYARKYFCFTLLEYRNMKTDDKIIIGRECYWKEVLLSRGKYGYNKN
ncbi:MAG: GIY-YIG nuclease family protein [Stygiobacter sp.]|nr:MAG: GIY-YIG nuclease family protein [Stygiobacter sp.]